MSIGISTASFYPLETEEALKIIAQKGVTCAEIFYNSERELKPSFTDYLLDIIKDIGLKITAIHPTLSVAEPYVIFSEYLRRFEDGQDTFRRYFETTARLGAKFINLHGDRSTGKLSVEEYCERFGILQELAESFGVILCQENVNGYRSADPEFLRDMVNILGNKANFTLDIKQCIRAGYTVDEIMAAMQGKIRHVHISDHSPASDCLLPLKGGFDFSALFSTLSQNGYKGDYIIEVYNNAYSDYDEIFKSYEKVKKL